MEEKRQEKVEKILLTPVEAAKFLGCGIHAVYEDLLKRKDFPYFMIGKKYYINKEELEAWTRQQCTKRK